MGEGAGVHHTGFLVGFCLFVCGVACAFKSAFCWFQYSRAVVGMVVGFGVGLFVGSHVGFAVGGVFVPKPTHGVNA